MDHTELIDIATEYIQGLLHVPVTTLQNTDVELTAFFSGYLPSFYTEESKENYIKQLNPSYPKNTITHFIDAFHINYLLCPYDQNNLIIIGPYITQSPSSKNCDKLLKENNITTRYSIAFHLFYESFPVCLTSTIQYACFLLVRRLLNLTENPPIHQRKQTPSKHKELLYSSTESDEIAKEKIEQRYEAEQRFLTDVYHGNKEAALMHYSEFIKLTKTIQRADTPLRSQKNLFFTLNTRLRTVAQNAGVHPLYVDNISGNFARLAEKCNNLDELYDLKNYVIPAYCQLVQQQTLKYYSPSVKNVIIYIKHHLEEAMTLNSLALKSKLSPNYLSKLFNHEVGESLPNYINQLRVDKAAHLLKTSNLPIKTICTQIGILDTNYFSKLFKRYYQVSPSVYRKQEREEF